LRQLDLLDVTAREHRRLQRALDRLEAEGPSVSPDDVAALALHLLRHEAMERVVLYPLLEREEDGQTAVAERISEQRVISRLIAHLLASPGGVDTEALTELKQAVVGHTDREEIEDFPRVRRTSTPDELQQLAKARRDVARQLAERVSNVPVSEDDGRGPIQRMEATAKDLLVESQERTPN
jgi:hypothetical protein